MNSKHAFLVLSTFTLVSIAYGEREVFAPTILAPVAEAGTIQFGDGTAAAPSMTFKNDPDTGIFRSSSNNVSIAGGGLSRFTVAGYQAFIGNDSSAAVPANGTLSGTNGNGTNINGATLVIKGGNSTGTGTGGPVVFSTSPAGSSGTSPNSTVERMRIDSTGLVGIGTTPSALLDVLNPSAAASAEVARFRGDTAGTPYIGFFNGANRTGYIQYSASTLFVNADADKNLQINTTGTGVIVQSTGGAERMRITAAGDIIAGNGDTSATPAAATIRGTNGSGTNIAAANLTIAGGRGTGTGAGGDLLFSTAAAGSSGSSLNAATERMRINSAGRVMINTTTVSNDTLNVNGRIGLTQNENVVWRDSSTNETAGIIGTSVDANNGYLSLRTRGGGTTSERMRIDSSGNVGIGTNTNLSTLTINGPIAPKGSTDVNAATYTVQTTDSSLRFTTTNCTVTLPAAASFPGRILWLNTVTANSVTSNASNVIPLGSNTAGTAIFAATAGKFAMIQSNGTNWVTMMSN